MGSSKELGILGYVSRQTASPGTILNITLWFVLLIVLLTNAAFIGTIAHDVHGHTVHMK